MTRGKAQEKQKEQAALLALAKRALFAAPVPMPDGTDYAALLSLCRTHMIHGVMSVGLQALDERTLDPDTLLPLQAECVTILSQNERLLAATDELCRFLESEDIPYVILKGSAVAWLYPVPDLRILGDIDCLIPTDGVKKTADFLLSRGYISRPNAPGEHHTVLRREGVKLELHTAMSGMAALRGEAAAASLCRDILKHATPATLGAHRFFAAAPHHQLLILLLHTRQHLLEGGMGLRQLFDLALLLHTHFARGEHAEAIRLVREWQLLPLAAALADICHRYLGVDDAVTALFGAANTAIADVLFSDMLQSGNFGAGDSAFDCSAVVTKERGSVLAAALKRAAKGTQEKWQLAAKHPIFTPVLLPFWVISRLFQKNAPISPFSMLRSARRRKRLYEALGLFSDKEI